ncbi:hypothetical protein RQP46_004458 [Phenoliferia psychrophenolica]
MVEWKGKMHKVKQQVLTLGPSSTITIARVKCPVPKGVPGHIIKRFDTGAVSASSLFRAAFPHATEESEAAEMAWISKGSRNRYGDTKAAGLEHDESKKLSGTWIPADKATGLAKEYNITKFALDLIAFKDTETSNDNVPDSETDSPVAAKSPRNKRARVASPSASTPTPKSPKVGTKAALSGASSTGVSILQTLATDPATGVTTKTAEVKVDVPLSAEATNGLIASDEIVNQQIAEAKKLVETLAAAGKLEMADATSPGTKRALEVDSDDEELPTQGTLADLAPADPRGFFGKIFKRAPKRGPVNAGRIVKGRPSAGAVAVAESKGERRWIAGVGLAVAVGATAAAPFLFG